MPADALQRVRQKYPEYADIPDQELAQRIITKYPEYTDLLGDIAQAPVAPEQGPNAISQMYTSAIKPVTQAVGSALGKVGEYADPIGWAEKLTGRDQSMSPESWQQSGQTVASIAIPQTPTQAAIMAGTGGAGMLARGAPAVTQAIMRTAGAGAGGALGALAEGHDPLEEGGKAAGITAGLEVAFPVLGKLFRSLPGMKAQIAGDDANKYLAELERQGGIMGYAGKGSAGARDVASGKGLEQLGANKEKVVQAIETVAPAIPVPSLGSSWISLREANDELSRIGDMMRGIRPLDPRYKDADLKQLYGAIARDIKTGIGTAAGPDAAAAWEAAQGTYKAGRALLNPLAKRSAFRTGEDLQFNTPEIQRALANPETERLLRSRLGDDGFEQLRDAMLRGGKPGDVDILTGGAGNVGSSLRQWLRGQNTGATQALRLPITSVLENVGSSYAGQAPYSVPQNARTLIDMLLNTAGAPGLRPDDQRR